MPGRTSDVSVSTFKPLSLQEILMVPLAKRKMEDQLLKAIGETEAISAKVRQDDKEASDSILNEFKEKASQLSDDILENGVSRSQSRKVRELRDSVKNEFATGTIAGLQANKIAQDAYLKDMSTNKARQAGHSPLEAMTFAKMHVNSFGSSIDKDGNFKSFSGKEMSSFMNEDDMLKEAADSVKANVSDITFKVLSSQGMEGLNSLVQQNQIEAKEYNTVVAAMISKFRNNPQMISHLRQQALIHQEQGDPLDMGKFESKTVVNPVTLEESEVDVFVPGESRIGRKISGAAGAESYKKVIHAEIASDAVLSQMNLSGRKIEKIKGLVGFQKGELISSLRPETITDNMKLLKEYKTGVDKLYDQSQAYLNQGISEYLSKNNLERNDENLLKAKEEVKKDPQYTSIYSKYSESKTGYDNANYRLKVIEEEIKGKFSSKAMNQKKALDYFNQFSGSENVGAQAFAKEGLTLNDEFKRILDGIDKGTYQGPWSRKDIDMAMAKTVLSQKFGIKGPTNFARAPLNFGLKDFIGNDYESERNKYITEYLESNPKAEYFNTISGLGDNVAAKFNELMTSNFNPDAATLSNNKGSLVNDPKYKELLANHTEKGKMTVKYDASTGAFDSMGNNFDTVTVTNSEGEHSTFQVIDELNTGEKMNIASMLINSGDGSKISIGEQMKANLNQMREIRKAGIQKDVSIIPITVGMDKYNAKVVRHKSDSGYYWEIESLIQPDGSEKPVKNRDGGGKWQAGGQDQLAMYFEELADNIIRDKASAKRLSLQQKQ